MDNRPYPKSGRRGCQCEDGTYRIDCCDGDSQGIGGLLDQSVSYYTFIDGSTGTTTTVRGLVDLTCSNLTLTGFAVSDTGSITLPTTSIGTITATSPASFDAVTEQTPRTLSVTITVPSGYSNSTQSIVCTTTTFQEAPALPTLSCSDITLSGFAVSYDGTITLPSTDIGTIVSTSPASFGDPDEDTPRTLNVNISVPSGYANAGATLPCTTSTIQPGTQPTLACSDITFTGLAVDFKGDITNPTLNIGTVASVSPTSFSGHVTTDTSRVVTVNVTVPSGYSNAGATLNCVRPAVTQSAVKEFYIKYSSSSITYPISFASSSSACSGTAISQANITANLTELMVHTGSSDTPTMTDPIYIVDSRQSSYTYFQVKGSNGYGFGESLGTNGFVGGVLKPIGASFEYADFVFEQGGTGQIIAITNCP